MDALYAVNPWTSPGGPFLTGGPALGSLGAADARMGLNPFAGPALAANPALAQSAMTQAMMGQVVQILAALMLNQGQNSALGTSPISANSSGSSALGGASSSGASAAGSSAGLGGSASAQPKDQNEVKSFLQKAAGAYGADANVLTEIARRESNFKADAVNNWDSNAKKGTPSKGMFQFIQPTFNSMAPKAKAANPQAWEGLGPFNWLDWRQQALVCAWAIKNGQGSHWSTYKAAGGK